MGRLDDRKRGTVFALLWWGRKALALSVIVGGWAVMLWWLFGTVSTKFAIDGGSDITWKTELEFAHGFWPVVGPIWLGVVLLGVGGPVAAFFGRRWLVWPLRTISMAASPGSQGEELSVFWCLGLRRPVYWQQPAISPWRRGHPFSPSAAH